MLEGLGLDPSVETVYRLLLGYPAYGVSEIAGHLSWSEQQVRDVLDTLADLRLVRLDAAAGRGLRPVNPQVALAALLARSERELMARQQQIEATRAAVATLAAEYDAHDDAVEVVHRLEGLDAVRDRLEDLARSARTECLSLLPGGSQKPDTMDASRPLDQQALERGVELRSVYQDSFRNDPPTWQYVQWLTALGGQTRTVPSLPMLMVIVDGETALVPLDPQDGRRGALELRSPGAVAAMRVMFEQFWAVAVPWGERAPLGPDGLSRQEQELLRLLADGDTDETAARKLGVSLRTVRRMAAGLMTRLCARSRFEAGVHAVERGWIGARVAAGAVLPDPGCPDPGCPDPGRAEPAMPAGTATAVTP